MKYLISLMILLPILGNASPRASTLEEILDCSYSVFYGEVVEGKVKSKSYMFESKEFVDKYGSYKIRVIENIAGKRQGHITKVFSEYSAIMLGGMSYFYPAPGLEYIFITWKEKGKVWFSPYHIPQVFSHQGKQYVSSGQHAFLDGVTYFYMDEWEIKEGVLMSKWDGDRKHEDVSTMLGYKLTSYIKEIQKKYGKCNPDD